MLSDWSISLTLWWRHTSDWHFRLTAQLIFEANWRTRGKQVWLWPNKAPGIVGSGLYDITIQCGSKDMSLETYILILQKKYRPHSCYHEFLYFSKWNSLFIIILLSKSYKQHVTSSSSLDLLCSVNSILTVLHFWRFCWNFWTFLFFCFLGLYKTILEVGLGLIHVVEQLSFSTIPSILAFEFDLIFGSFWLFGALMS